MKVLTLRQPWASLIQLGVKTIETRSWSTKYRGPLAIHAGARKPRRVWSQDGPPELYDLIAIERHLEIAEDTNNPGQFAYDWSGPLGAIVATCTLVDVVPIINRDRTPGAPVEGTYLLRGTGGLGRVVLGLFDKNGYGICTTNGNADDHPYTAAHQWRDMTDDLPYGDYQTGRYAYLLADIVPVDPPVPFKGGQRLSRTWEP